MLHKASKCKNRTKTEQMIQIIMRELRYVDSIGRQVGAKVAGQVEAVLLVRRKANRKE